GFREFTRIASSDPRMWRDVFVANGAATVKILDQYVADLAVLREALLKRDGDFLENVFRRAKSSRDRFMSQQHSKIAVQEAHDLVYTVQPGGSLRGDLRIPGDKSISHR